MANSDFTHSQRNTIWQKYFGMKTSGYDAFGRFISKTNFECDHIWPKSKGGSTTVNNGQPLSPSSNSDKYNNTSGIINGRRFKVNRYGNTGIMYVNGAKYTK